MKKRQSVVDCFGFGGAGVTFSPALTVEGVVSHERQPITS